MPPDPIDQAVEAAGAAPEPVPMRQFQATIASSGRPGVIILPVDATDGEIAEFCGWVLSAVLNTYRQERAAAAGPKLVIASRLPT